MLLATLLCAELDVLLTELETLLDCELALVDEPLETELVLDRDEADDADVEETVELALDALLALLDAIEELPRLAQFPALMAFKRTFSSAIFCLCHSLCAA